MLFSAAKRPGKYLISALQYRIDKEFQKLYFEQMMYQGAFLAKCSSNYAKEGFQYEKVAEECNQMSLQEHRIFVNGEYTEQTYKILRSLHKISRNIPVIYDPHSYSSSKDILDPNMFPIQTSKSKESYIEYESIWEQHIDSTVPLLTSKIGYVLQRQPSTISHPQAGYGVFILNDRPVAPGTLLGFYPGILYSKDCANKAKAEVHEKTELPYLLRYNGDAVFHDEHLFYPCYKLGFGCEEYIDRIEKLHKTLPIEVLPQMINPYALGHLINHPPPNTPPNVCFIDFEIPENLFPSFLLTHFPYMRYSINPSAPPTSFHVIGVIALQELQNQELFVNYGTEKYPNGFIPEWLQEPPDNLPIANFLCKEDCLHEFSRINKILLKWDEFSLSEMEKLERKIKEDKQKRAKEAMEDPKLFEKYYKK